MEFCLGISSALEGDVPSLPLKADLAAIGQDLFSPPTTAGWAGGSHWINSVTMLGRAKLAGELVAAQGRYGGKLDVPAAAKEHHCADAQQAARWLLDVLLQDDVNAKIKSQLIDTMPARDVAAATDQLRETAVRIMALPEYQLC